LVGAAVVVTVIASWVGDHDEQTLSPRESARAVQQPKVVTKASIARLPLGGVPLELDTGLRLLVADAPAPFLLDVVRGTVRRITGLPTRGERGVSVVAVGDDALILSSRFCRACHSTSAFLLLHGSTAATSLVTADSGA